MKTILLIAHSSSQTGGGEEDFLRLLKFLKNKFNIIGIFPEGKKIEDYKNYVIDYLVIPNQMFPFTKFRLKNYAAYFIRGFKKIRMIKVFLKKKDISLVYIHSSVCLYETLTVVSLKLPYIIAIREFINPVVIRKVVYKFFLKTAKKIIVISKILELEFEKLKINNDKTELIYLSIENNNLTKSTPTDKIIILNIGNIFPEKGQDKVLEAISKLNLSELITLRIIGANVDAQYYNYLKKLVKKYDLKKIVEFKGELSRQDVLNEIANCSFVIISSFQEGFSLVLLEVLSQSKPIISTKVGVIPEIIIDENNGLLYDFENAKMLSEKIQKLIIDKKQYSQIANNGYKTFVEKFDLQQSLNKILDVLEKNLK